MKILIVHPDFDVPGGVSESFRKLENKFSCSIQHHVIGSRLNESGWLSKANRIVSDYVGFVRKLRRDSIDVVHVNPSLDKNAFARDGVLVWLAGWHGKKIVVFFRGWNREYEQKISRRGRWLFRLLYGSANTFIVLAKDFQVSLEAWGCTQPIVCEVTIADDDNLADFNVERAVADRQAAEHFRLLFLSRLEREKGLDLTIQAVSLLRERIPEIELIVSGDGPALQPAQALAAREELDCIRFTGHITGIAKQEMYLQSHVFVLPTSYGEGLPNSVVEAMAVGLPVVTCAVGGLADFFEDGVHGFIVPPDDPEKITEVIERLRHDPALYQSISIGNYRYAQKHFLASQQATRLEQIYENVLRG